MKRVTAAALLLAVIVQPAQAGFLESILPKVSKSDPTGPQPNVDLRSATESSRFFAQQAQAIMASPKGNQAAYQQMLLLAQNGYSDALVFLGYLSDNGLGGVAVNPRYAAQYFREAAARGNALGYHNLGALFLLGRGVPQDARVAMKLLETASKKGIKHSTVLMALYYESHKKFSDAARLFSAVADDKTHPYATSRHGHYLLRGLGANQSLPGAFTMISKAAELWDADAQWALIEMYANGIGTTQNSIEAMKWVYVLQQNPYALKYHPRLGAHGVSITPDDLERARKSANLWISTHSPVLRPVDYSRSIWIEDIRKL